MLLTRKQALNYKEEKTNTFNDLHGKEKKLTLLYSSPSPLVMNFYSSRQN